MSIKNVKIQNFTIFENIEIDFTGEINVLIGENGTGKTHLMKAMYAMLNEHLVISIEDKRIPRHATEMKEITSITTSTSQYFSSNTTNLRNNNCKRDEKSAFEINLNNATIYNEFVLQNDSSDFPPYESSSAYVNVDFKYGQLYTFIPAKDMLTHSKGFMSLYNKFELPFDKTYYDIISKSLLPNLKEVPQIGLSILPKLEKIIGGKVIVENDTFFIEKTDGRKIEFSVEAEGIKKIAHIWQLIMNESITKGTVLFWDEPEANINPSLIPDVVEILLELSRSGVQIFIATHDYTFAKYLEVLMNESDDIAFHALYKTENEGVKCETKSKFTYLENNSIVKEKIALYKEEVKRSME